MTVLFLQPRILRIVASGFVVGMGWAGCGGAKSPNGAVLRTGEVVRRTLDTVVEVAGELEPFQKVEVKPEVSARVKKILVAVGQVVAEGVPLVQLDDTDLLSEKRSAETDIAGARMECEQAQRTFARAERLFQKKLVSQEVYDEAMTARDVSKNALEKTQRRLQIVLDHLAKTRIVAPMGGTVLSIPVAEGQVVVAAASVNSGTTLMSLADLGRMQINTHINQVDVAQVHVGQKVEFGVDAILGVTMEGEIGLVAPIATVKNNVKGFEVKVWLKGVDSRVRPGMTANVSIPMQRAENVLSVPVHAVFTESGGRKVVYILKETGPELREVTVGINTLDAAEIKTGLEEGETVLLQRPEAGAKQGAPSEPGKGKGKRVPKGGP